MTFYILRLLDRREHDEMVTRPKFPPGEAVMLDTPHEKREVRAYALIIYPDSRTRNVSTYISQ